MLCYVGWAHCLCFVSPRDKERAYSELIRGVEVLGIADDGGEM